MPRTSSWKDALVHSATRSDGNSDSWYASVRLI